MPPDGRMDARADVYAAGLTVYEMITGLPVTCFPSLGDHAEKFADDPILQRLNRLVLRACQTAPDARYENAREMLGELTRAQPTEAKWSFRHRGWIGVCVACLLLAIVLTIVHRWTSQRRASAGQLRHRTVRGNHPTRWRSAREAGWDALHHAMHNPRSACPQSPDRFPAPTVA